MGSTSGRPGASRHRRGGDGDRVRTSLIGGGRRGEYQQPSAPDHRAPQGGAPEHGAPQYGAPEYGAPRRGVPQYGAPQYGAPDYRAQDGRGAGTVLRGFVEPEERDGILARLTALLRREDAGRRAGRRRRGTPFSGPVIAVTALVASCAVIAAAVGITHAFTASNAADAAAPNPNCTIIVPANPLTAQGLATPYQLTATDPAGGPCNEANANQTAFVQGAILDPATGAISVYNPLVIDAGTQPAVAPTVPVLPAGAVVALWFGNNGNTLTLAGPDQVPPTGSPSTAASTASTSQSAPTSPTTAASTSGTPTSSATATPTGTATPTTTSGGSGTSSPTAPGSGAPTSSGTPTDSGSPTGTVSPTDSGTPTGTPSATGTGAAPVNTVNSASVSSSRAGVQDVAAAPLPPGGNQSGNGYNGTLTTPGTGTTPTHHHHPTSGPSTSATPTGSASGTPTSTVTATPTTGTPTTGTPAVTPTTSLPPSNPGDSPAASGSPDATLQQANCVAGEEMGGQFSSFTQVAACNAVAFFAAANAAVKAGQLKVPAPGTAKDGKACLTTRSFALIDQDQSDNVTSEYLANGNGQTAQDTAANRQALGNPGILFNGSDNGLLDFFMDPALGCSPWTVPDLANGGAPATALPLDELQAATYTGGSGQPLAALVPMNDPMTLDNNGQFSTDKTNTYRSLVDMAALPAGESPSAYCSDMERIQGKRLQQDVNLLMAGPSPIPNAADNLFTFLAMRLQQSFVNLNCGSFGVSNQVSVTADGNGVVVAACFTKQFSPVTSGPGNPMHGHRHCPATTGGPGQSGGSPSPTATPTSSHSYGYQGYSDHDHKKRNHHM
jgi:hypothetical protein